MPMKLNIGWQKKVGQPDFGSLGASCHLEVEVESSLVREPDQLRERIKYLFDQAKQAVEEELNGSGTGNAISSGHNGNINGNSNGSAHNTNGNGHQATDKQLGYARQLANQISGLGIRRLDELTNKMFSKPVTELTTLDASGLIDTLKQLKAGDIDLAAALNGVTT